MALETRAVIDVGTNSVKLLVATVSGETIMPLIEESKQTRLGKGFYDTHLLSPDAIHQTALAVAEFAAIARDWKARPVKVIATSAARDALNQGLLIAALEKAAGEKVQVISGDREAELAFAGVCSDPAFRTGNILVMDVGGGSTELIAGSDGDSKISKSFRLGTVRLLESLLLSNPPQAASLAECENKVRQVLEREAQPWLAAELRDCRDAQLVGTGGTAAIMVRMKLRLRRYDRELIEQTAVSLAEIQLEKHRLWSLTLEERKEIVGLPASRADVILTGIVIFSQFMEVFGIDSLRVSLRGLRFAALKRA
jgi:exopolyphosphatase/guanosine-5'-triphosphate,3'-diphosphate pyrophosphatase